MKLKNNQYVWVFALNNSELKFPVLKLKLNQEIKTVQKNN